MPALFQLLKVSLDINDGEIVKYFLLIIYALAILILLEYLWNKYHKE